MVIYFLDVMCGELADIDAIDRNQRQAEGIESTQKPVQSSLINRTNQGCNWLTIALAFLYNKILINLKNTIL